MPRTSLLDTQPADCKCGMSAQRLQFLQRGQGPQIASCHISSHSALALQTCCHASIHISGDSFCTEEGAVSKLQELLVHVPKLQELRIELQQVDLLSSRPALLFFRRFLHTKMRRGRPLLDVLLLALLL